MQTFPRSRYRRSIGAAPGYDPNWCGREVCGPPPPPPRTIVTVHLGPPPAPPPLPPAIRLQAPPPTATPPTTIVSFPAPPPLVPPPTLTRALPPMPSNVQPPSGECACSWIPIALAALAGFGVTYVAQSKKAKERKRGLHAAG